jgi:hypothetical protein
MTFDQLFERARRRPRGSEGRVRAADGTLSSLLAAMKQRADAARCAGRGTYVQALGRVEAPLEVERLPAPALLHQRDAFLHDGLPAVGRAPIRNVWIVLQRAAAPDAHVEASAADDVQHGELLGQVRQGDARAAG